MDFLHVVYDFPAGGIETIIRNVCRLNSDHQGTRHDIALINGNSSIYFSENYKIFNCRLRENGFISCFFYMKNIINSYDVIFLHSPHPLPAAACLLAGKPVFSFQHGMTLSSKNLFKRIGKYLWYHILVFFVVKSVVCSTEYAYLKMIKRGLHVPRRRVVFVCFGVKTPLPVAWAESLRRPGQLQIGTAGRFVDQKRFDSLLESLRNYSRKTHIVLHVAGDGPDKEKLQRLADQVSSHRVDIHFHGWLECLDDFYDLLDLFVFTSKDESLGLVVLESLVRGIPVVILRDVGGALEFVRDGTNGVILDNEQQFKSLWIRCCDLNFVHELRRGAYSLRDHVPTCEKMRGDLELICQLVSN